MEELIEQYKREFQDEIEKAEQSLEKYQYKRDDHSVYMEGILKAEIRTWKNALNIINKG